MANIKHFSGETELENIFGLDNAKFAAAFPGVKGRRWDGFARIVGMPVGYQPVWTGKGYSEDLRPVERVIAYKSNPSKHKCDGRCLNAKGGNCECECGGKNHGAGFHCEAA